MLTTRGAMMYYVYVSERVALSQRYPVLVNVWLSQF